MVPWTTLTTIVGVLSLGVSIMAVGGGDRGAVGDDGRSTPLLPPMRTCAVGSPAADKTFCDQSKSHEDRARLLASELTQVCVCVCVSVVVCVCMCVCLCDV